MYMEFDYRALWHALKKIMESKSVDPRDYCTPKSACQCGACDPAHEFDEGAVLKVMQKLEREMQPIPNCWNCKNITQGHTHRFAYGYDFGCKKHFEVNIESDRDQRAAGKAYAENCTDFDPQCKHEWEECKHEEDGGEVLIISCKNCKIIKEKWRLMKKNEHKTGD